MLLSQSILNQFGSNFGFYILGPILTKYMISKQISTNPTTSNLQISTTSNAFISVNSRPTNKEDAFPHQTPSTPEIPS